jgi:predicted metal-dependent hydrolase
MKKVKQQLPDLYKRAEELAKTAEITSAGRRGNTHFSSQVSKVIQVLFQAMHGQNAQLRMKSYSKQFGTCHKMIRTAHRRMYKVRCSLLNLKNSLKMKKV